MKKLAYLLLPALFAAACSKSAYDDSTPQQPTVTVDSSEFNGMLRAEVNDQSNNKAQNIAVSLFSTYEDLKNNLYLYKINTTASGLADFGYVLQGNYYLLAKGTAPAADTVVVQVLSRRETKALMKLK